MGLMGGISVNMIFSKWEHRRIVDRIRLGDYFYRFTESLMVVGEDEDGETTESDRIGSPTHVDVEKELGSIFRNPRSFRRTALDQYRILLVSVEKAFHSHSVKKQIFEDYLNDGIPPEYALGDLGVREEEEQLEIARTRIQGWITDIGDQYMELHQVLMSIAPFYEVWK